jgi:hypothetical protein
MQVEERSDEIPRAQRIGIVRDSLEPDPELKFYLITFLINIII